MSGSVTLGGMCTGTPINGLSERPATGIALINQSPTYITLSAKASAAILIWTIAMATPKRPNGSLRLWTRRSLTWLSSREIS